jgi:hypothetical protein
LARVKAILGFFGLMLLLSAAARAQTDIPPGDPIMARLSAEKSGVLKPGQYSAGEGREFSVTPYRGKYLLRFADGDENFVLTADPASLGSELLKYDTGAAALSVSVWGGVTLYAADAPGGLPATHQGDATAPSPVALSAAELRGALRDEASHFSYADSLGLRFSADAASLADPDSRAMAFDTLANTQAGIERFLAAAPAAHQALARRVALVKLEKSKKPGVSLSGRTLVVHFVPADGYLGRDSSHAIAHQLGKLLAVNTAE